MLFSFVFCFWVWWCMIMSLKQKETKFKPRMKLNHNIYKNYLNKFCSQEDFFSSSHIHVPSSWVFLSLRFIKKFETNWIRANLIQTLRVYKKSFFFRLFDTRESFLPFFKQLISLKKHMSSCLALKIGYMNKTHTRTYTEWSWKLSISILTHHYESVFSFLSRGND